ncbi:MAG: hypothetical protein CEN87_432 [Parcubacteria group bacterium Licking1014_1]|nr:MAG: hypothetical protein CEN87_432 [Parcubacteria group bacterium Licking1014_1]
MNFIIKNINENISNIARKLGYVIIDSKEYNEYNMVRKLGYDNYPRFHIYLKQAGDKLIFNLHLDQKQPSYRGSHAHAGEYEGPVVETEAEKIIELLKI